jgi:hypothetical protein
METLKFKTTIKCSGCVGKATPFLDAAVGKDNWEVDIQNPDKVLTVATGQKVGEETVLKAILEAGYKAERLS